MLEALTPAASSTFIAQVKDREHVRGLMLFAIGAKLDDRLPARTRSGVVAVPPYFDYEQCVSGAVLQIETYWVIQIGHAAKCCMQVRLGADVANSQAVLSG